MKSRPPNPYKQQRKQRTLGCGNTTPPINNNENDEMLVLKTRSPYKQQRQRRQARSRPGEKDTPNIMLREINQYLVNYIGSCIDIITDIILIRRCLHSDCCFPSKAKR